MTDRNVPTQVMGLTNVTKIASGPTSSLALTADGTVWVWGYTCCGAAGDGTVNAGANDPSVNRLVPAQVHILDQVVAVTAGSNHHMALRADGTVWTWGIGISGENGTGPLTTSTNQQLLPVQIPSLDHVVAIETMGASLALKADGTVWAWGGNSNGRLGVSGITYSATPIQVPGVSDIVAISAGDNHVLAMRRDGTVLAWGSNRGAQLGDGSLQSRAEPRLVSGPGGTGLLNLLQPAPASFNRLPRAQVNLSATSGRAPLTVTARVSDASDSDGTITGYSWTSSDGQQATGPSVNFTFAQAGTYQINLLIEDNAGGRGSAAGQQVVVAPAPVGVSVNPKVGMGEQSSIALANDGRILAWGLNGLLGFYNTSAYVPFSQTNSLPIANGIVGAIDFAIFDLNAHVLLADGTVLSWGSNSSGELGTGSPLGYVSQPQLVPNLPPAQALAAGHFHKMALTRDGRVFAWGGNIDGQIGVGDNDNRYLPTEVTGLSNVIAITAGLAHSAALKSDGSVWAWGRNINYELGDGTQIARKRPYQIPGLANITKLFPGASNIFAQKADGTIWVTGGLPGVSGGTGQGSGPRYVSAYDGVVQFAGDFKHVIALKADGTVWTGGLQSTLALGFQNSGDISGLRQLPGISDVIGVAVGRNTSMALRRDGTVLSWGYSSAGQLGDGTLAPQQTPVLVANETANGFLDLIPEVPNIIPRDLIPPFFLATYADGGLSSTTLYADLRGIIPSASFASTSDFGRFAAGYNVYVAAGIPLGGAPLFLQLDSSNGWSVLRWPMAEFMRGVALDSRDALVRAQILQNVDLSSPQLAGTSIIVGYGTDPDEMARSGRYRTIFTVPQP